MAILVVEFSREGYKIRKVFGYKLIFQKETKVLCELMVKKVQNSEVQSNFYVKNDLNLSKKKSLKNIDLGYSIVRDSNADLTVGN